MLIAITLETIKIRSPSQDIASSLEEQLLSGLISDSKLYQRQRTKLNIWKYTIKQKKKYGYGAS